MKSIVFSMIFLAGSIALACNKKIDLVDDDKVYAEINAGRSNTSLSFIAVIKQEARGEFVKIVGGQGFTDADVPSCDSDEKPYEMRSLNSFSFAHYTGSPTNYTTAYRICFENEKGDSYGYILCDTQVGD